ncbi:TonB-dependent receptor family protein [Novosphingobium colocasiae]|uniref:TonB-dependent receptor family protein n=1 Tax=Novosphingobium colocasiae TaxID=1256513 RepID=UPI0035AFFBC1
MSLEFESSYKPKAVLTVFHATSVLALAACWAAPAYAGQPGDAAIPSAEADAEAAGTIIVTGTSVIETARKQIQEIPGGAGIVDQADVEKGRVLTNQDVLAFQPGVYAQSAGGADGLKISIRGSAVNRGTNFFRTGILFQFDGLPVTGPGGTPYELFEPLGLKYTEVLRGANGFDQGSSYLGGAINYVTRTGRDDARLLEARLEGGSYGYLKGQVASGGQFGKFDYYVSGTYSRRNGYQTQSAGRSFGVLGNLGIQLTPNIETRFYVRYRETTNETPGSLTRDEISNNPRTADPLNVARDAKRIQPGSWWIANKTTFTLGDESQLSVGFVYHDYPIDIRTQNIAKWGYTTLSGVVDYTRTDTLFGRDSVTRIGLLTADNTRGWQKVYNRYTIDPGTTKPHVSGLPAGALLRTSTYDGADRNLHINNTSEPLSGLKLTLGAALLNIYRATKVTYPASYETVKGSGIFLPTEPYSRSSWDYTVRTGLQYAVTPEVQVYGNFSRSVEPANDWSHLSTAAGTFVSGPAVTQAVRGLALKDQTAWTGEIGARGNSPILGHWEISAYRAWVKNELLSVVIQQTPTLITAESNATPTIHQGIEAGFETTLWHAPNDAGTNITTRHAYTYSDFHFRKDAQWDQNTLPSLPPHFYQGELTFNHKSGFYASVDVQASSAYYVDYANSFKTRAYAIFGGTLGYSPSDSDWSAFVDFRNIGDKGYVAAVSPVFNAAGLDGRRSNPGDGFSIIGGISVKLGR